MTTEESAEATEFLGIAIGSRAVFWQCSCFELPSPTHSAQDEGCLAHSHFGLDTFHLAPTRRFPHLEFRPPPSSELPGLAGARCLWVACECPPSPSSPSCRGAGRVPDAGVGPRWKRRSEPVFETQTPLVEFFRSHIFCIYFVCSVFFSNSPRCISLPAGAAPGGGGSTPTCTAWPPRTTPRGSGCRRTPSSTVSWRRSPGASPGRHCWTSSSTNCPKKRRRRRCGKGYFGKRGQRPT